MDPIGFGMGVNQAVSLFHYIRTIGISREEVKLRVMRYKTRVKAEIFQILWLKVKERLYFGIYTWLEIKIVRFIFRNSAFFLRTVKLQGLTSLLFPFTKSHYETFGKS